MLNFKKKFQKIVKMKVWLREENCENKYNCENWYTIRTADSKDTNRKIRKTEFIYICGSKNGSSSSTVNTGEVWGDMSHAQKALRMFCKAFGTKIQIQ